ncbi:putative esterase [Rhexocercosporidium sp. MPI-PUGE-AT-0058]|nr:putative esterase [Rhexocercosporidium sp. MPI-PUGE-AT-0058]
MVHPFWFIYTLILVSTTGCLAVSLPQLSFINTTLHPDISVLDLLELPKRAAKPFYLRIAPLGASISNGYLSTDGNGYRKYLRDQLRFDGWPVNMVGSINTGSMKDNENEGHLGWTIQQVTDSALPNIITLQPNLVLINVGANNAGQNNGISTAAGLYIELLDKLWAGIPGATVILSTLLPNKNSDTNAGAVAINEQIRTTVASHYVGLNKRFAIADMNDGFITVADLNDETHPLDSGYKKMASVWWAAIQRAERNGWLIAPANAGFSDATTEATIYNCPKVYGAGDGNYQIQRGSGTDSGKYVHASEDQGVVWTAPTLTLKGDINYGDNFFFAQLVNFSGVRGAEVDDIIMANFTGKTWAWQFWVNNNNNAFAAGQSFDPGYSCPPNASRFADLNNDGLDDFVCIDTQGNLRASINEGGNPPFFRPYGIIGTSPRFWSSAYTVDLVYLADIDGDGRADWCILVELGSVSCLRNGGQGILPIASAGGFWQGFKSSSAEDWTVVFPGQGRGNAAGVNLVDLNGDFKADWLFMTPTGQVDTFINNRGTGQGMVPDWEYVNVTHGGLSSFGVTNANSVVKFGRMYGTGKRDYIWIQAVPLVGNFASAIQIHVWKNLGSGGTFLKGDGTHYCDMDGDGKDDYVWVGPNGLIDIYLNTNNRPFWENHGSVITLGVSRKTIHIADLNGDGRCDLLSVDRNSGAIRMWLNTWNPGPRTWSFTDKGIVSGAASCTMGYGVVENDLGVRFADLTGDGKADYLCIWPNGRVDGYLNRGMSSTGQISFEDVRQIKSATNYDRQDIRFHDVNGDGRADLLWIDKYSGDTAVQINDGEIPSSGSHFHWGVRAVLYKGWDRGSNMVFGAIGGQHRADIIQVIPKTNVAYISYNKCASGNGSGGDDADMGNPGLPLYKSPWSLRRFRK